jgi:hypothetical protein
MKHLYSSLVATNNWKTNLVGCRGIQASDLRKWRWGQIQLGIVTSLLEIILVNFFDRKIKLPKVHLCTSKVEIKQDQLRPVSCTMKNDGGGYTLVLFWKLHTVSINLVWFLPRCTCVHTFFSLLFVGLCQNSEHKAAFIFP